MKIFKVFFIMSGLMFSMQVDAAGDQWTSNFGDWICYGKSGVIEENYAVNEMFANNPNIDDQNIYNMLCTLDYEFTLNNGAYAFHILFPDCQFSSDNERIVVRLVQYKEHTSQIERNYNDYRKTATIFDGDQYKITFPTDKTDFTGTDINRDQNAKGLFFIDLISQSDITIEIQDIGSTTISLDGVRQVVQSPYCNQK